MERVMRRTYIYCRLAIAMEMVLMCVQALEQITSRWGWRTKRMYITTTRQLEKMQVTGAMCMENTSDGCIKDTILQPPRLALLMKGHKR